MPTAEALEHNLYNLRTIIDIVPETLELKIKKFEDKILDTWKVRTLCKDR